MTVNISGPLYTVVMEIPTNAVSLSTFLVVFESDITTAVSVICSTTLLPSSFGTHYLKVLCKSEPAIYDPRLLAQNN